MIVSITTYNPKQNEPLQRMNNPKNTSEDLTKELQELKDKYTALEQIHQQTILDYQQTEKDLREREINYFGLFNTVKQAIYIQNPDLTFINVNQGALDMYGYKREDFIGKTPVFLSAEGKNDLNKIADLIKRAFEGKPQHFEFWGLKKDGTVFPKDVWTVKGSYFGKDVAITIANDITEKKRILDDLIIAKENAEESEAQFKSLFQNAADAIIIADAETGIIIETNQAAEHLMQMTRRELIGLHQTQLHPGEAEAYAKDTFQQHYHEARQSEKTNLIENFIVRKDGSKIPVGILAFEVKYKGKRCLVGTFRDATKRKRAEAELLQAKETAEANSANVTAIIEGTQDSIWAFDRNYNILYINQMFQKEFHTTFGVWLVPGVNLIESLPEQIRPFWKPRYDRVLNNEQFSVEDAVETENGTIYIQVTFNPIIQNSEVVGGSCFGSNITSRKLAEIELMQAKEHAEESDRLKTAFLQNMSHEIRTPLNAISGFSGLLNNPDLSEEKRKSFTTILQNSSNQLISIVTDILTISSIETKQERANISKVCINNIIVDLVSIFKQLALNQNINVYSKQALNDEQSEIYTDKTKLTQILSNLLTNALKFTYEGFIEFGYTLKETELEFYVKDSGIGIQPEHHDKIFERFRQADILMSRKYGGTGLGLAISKAFVELLGGQIWLDSDIDVGTTIYFTMPYKPVNKINNTPKPIASKENRNTIIIAEDEQYNYLYIEEILNGLNYNIIHTKNGQETIEACESTPNINLILMDIKMPVMDGYEAAKIIKQIRPHIPIVAQSAYGLEHERAKYEDMFDDYLTKPITIETIKKVVDKYVD